MCVHALQHEEKLDRTSQIRAKDKHFSIWFFFLGNKFRWTKICRNVCFFITSFRFDWWKHKIQQQNQQKQTVSEWSEQKKWMMIISSHKLQLSLQFQYDAMRYGAAEKVNQANKKDYRRRQRGEGKITTKKCICSIKSNWIHTCF